MLSHIVFVNRILLGPRTPTKNHSQCMASHHFPTIIIISHHSVRMCLLVSMFWGRWWDLLCSLSSPVRWICHRCYSLICLYVTAFRYWISCLGGYVSYRWSVAQVQLNQTCTQEHLWWRLSSGRSGGATTSLPHDPNMCVSHSYGRINWWEYKLYPAYKLAVSQPTFSGSLILGHW